MPGGEAGAQRGKWRRRRRPVPLPQSPFLVRAAVLVGEDPGGSIGSDPTRTGDRVCFGLVAAVAIIFKRECANAAPPEMNLDATY